MVGYRPWWPAAGAVEQRERAQQDRQAAGHREEVLPPAPIEVARADQLPDQDQPEQRRRPVEDVLVGGEVLAEERQAGAAK
jgi:hypothetical protein